MIKKVRIKNFKSHIDNEVPFRALTVLTGANSSGKSSVMQSLLLLRQSHLKNRLEHGLDITEPLCKIGTGQDALSVYATEGRITFEVDTDYTGNLKFSFKADDASLKDSFFYRDEYSANTSPKLLDTLPLFNNNFQYLSADRLGGKDEFDKDTFAVGFQRQISNRWGMGELVAEFLYKYGNDQVAVIDPEELGDMPTIAEQVETWERKISPDITIEAQQTSESGKYKINYGFKAEGRKPVGNLKASNIGYGVSYTLPVIVALLAARPGDLLLIENPEAHLHPEGQLALASLITRVAAGGAQVVVETHSDHIINGILLACKAHEADGAKGIAKEDVAINEFHWSANQGSKCEEVVIGDRGILEHQPQGFFDQNEKALLELYS